MVVLIKNDKNNQKRDILHILVTLKSFSEYGIQSQDSGNTSHFPSIGHGDRDHATSSKRGRSEHFTIQLSKADLRQITRGKSK